MPLQLIIVMLLAACIAGQLNRGIYRFAWHKRWFSPWTPVPVGAQVRNWLDRIPVYGWWRLRRESKVHGAGFWMRPALIELGFIVGLAGLYAFELHGGLLPVGAALPSRVMLRAQFFNHACLVAMMIMATFIDLDEKTIPDEVTVSGTLLAVLLAALLPAVSLPAWTRSVPPVPIELLRLTTPEAWQPSLDGRGGVAVAGLCILGWWYAVIPKTLWYRGGTRKFFLYLGASLLRGRFSPGRTLLAVGALTVTLLVWHHGGDRWQAVLSAWVGLAVGGMTVWLVRIVAGAALGQEAMGFGDVTLMGMIGAFLGWQPALLVFFLAPFAGVLIAVTQWLLTGRKDIAYGPFLCLAAVLLLVGWAEVWQSWGLPVFSLGALVPSLLLCSLLLLGGLLWGIQRVKATVASKALRGRDAAGRRG